MMITKKLTYNQQLLQFFDVLFEFFVVGAAEGVYDVLVFDEYKSWHRGNIVVHGDIVAFIDINLEKTFR